MPNTVLSVRTPPTTSKTGVSVVADTKQLAKLARDLRSAAPAAWKAYRVAARALAQPVLADAQARASFSKRIPSSGKIRVTGGGNIKVVFGGESAPDAAAIENRGRGHVRHPVHGHRDRWTDKNSHPAFLAPAFDAHREAVMRGIEAAVFEAVERAVAGRF